MSYSNMKKDQEESPPSPKLGWSPNAIPMMAPPSCGPGPYAASSGAYIAAPGPHALDPEDLTLKNFSFSDASIRKGFIRKVYLILMAQLLVTFGVVAVFLYHPPLQRFSAENPQFVMIALLLTLVIVIAMACCETTRRVYPMNMICLSVFTLAESFLVGTIASRYNTDVVIMAVGITALLCLTLSIFAMQTKYDFTACGGFLLICLVCLIIFGMVGMFWRDHIVHTIYAGAGALLACVFLIFDTQVMMGGEHKYSISPEEYVFAALNLYLDVIRIFLFILQLFGRKD